MHTHTHTHTHTRVTATKQHLDTVWGVHIYSIQKAKLKVIGGDSEVVNHSSSCVVEWSTLLVIVAQEYSLNSKDNSISRSQSLLPSFCCLLACFSGRKR